jgi:hypothetical protein
MSLSVRSIGVWVSGLMALLLVWGTVLRLNNLDQKSLWSDELFTLGIAKYQSLLPKQGQPLYRQIQVHDITDADTFLTAKAAEQSPPLNDLLEKAALNLPINMELASRLPAALSSCLMLFWFAAFAWHHPDPQVRRVLKWTLALVALHPSLVVFAREGRPYSLGVSLAGMAGLLWLLRWRNGWRAWQPPGWVEIALFTLACFSHYNAALFVALLLSADAVVATRARSGTACIRLLSLGVAFSIWLALNAHAILFTAQGGVAWTNQSVEERTALAPHDAVTALHPSWLAFTLGLGFCLLIYSWQQGKLRLWSESGVRQWALGGVCTGYVCLSALMVSKAGMGHPRYYIFIIPFVSVMMGMALAELRMRWLALGALVLLVLLAEPTGRLKNSLGQNDFRSMAWTGSRGADERTRFLYPLEANRNFYRLYLERFLGEDPLPRMTGISYDGQVPEVCEKLKHHNHVVVVSHWTGRRVIESVYAACGKRWPLREQKEFSQTFTEHWRSP